MALALVKYEEFFLLVSGYLYGARGACQVGYRTTSLPMCIAMKELCHSKGGFLYLLANWKPSGPNLLDEPLKGFIVYPACSPL